MTRRRAALFVRIAVLAGLVILLEICCRTGIIDPLTVIPPSEMIVSMVDHIGSGEFNESIVNTFSTIILAFVLAIGCGTLAGALVHRSSRLRDVADPLLASYYSVPTFIFYPLAGGAAWSWQGSAGGARGPLRRAGRHDQHALGT